MQPVTLPPEPSEHGLTKRPVVDLGAYKNSPRTNVKYSKYIKRKTIHFSISSDTESRRSPLHLETEVCRLREEPKLL